MRWKWNTQHAKSSSVSVDLSWQHCPVHGTPERPAVMLTATAVGGRHDGVVLRFCLPDAVLDALASFLIDTILTRADDERAS